MKDRREPAISIVVVIISVLSIAIGLAVLALPPASAARLHPGAVPGLLAAVAMLASLLAFRRRGGEAAPDRPGPRALVATVVALLVLAFGTRTTGLAAATLAAATIAAAGVAGTSLRRAATVGLGIACAVSLLAVSVRQPLPVLPPGLWR